MTSYRLNPAGFREHVLNAEFMVAHMAARAERGAAFARSIAPVDETGPHPGRYLAGITSDSGRYGPPGSAEQDRAYGTVWATAPESAYVEFGTEHNPAHHVMARTLDVLR